MPSTKRMVMETKALEERLASMAPQFEKASPLIVGFSFLVTVVLAAQLYMSPPSFQTDLNDFAPDSEATDAHDRIHEHFPNETRPMFVHVTADDGANVLSIDALHAMAEDLVQFENESYKRQQFIHVWTTAPGIVQHALDEQAAERPLNSVETWTALADLVFTENESCSLSADDQLLSSATYASSALLHRDLNFDPVCQYLDEGTGDATPYASSTMWILETNPDLTDSERRELQAQMRSAMEEQSQTSPMSYQVISNDLLAHDIDEGTFDNLLFLVFVAFAVVVVMLAVGFRSVNHVLFPLIGLSSALVWTYGLLNVSGARFTALEATVAPLVLGLGIDYAIHLQRRQRDNLADHPTVSESWMRAVGHLSVPLGLAIITTVAAFLANIISPLPPLATLGYALSLGVVAAFLSSTFFVGALHVMFTKDVSPAKNGNFSLPRVTERLMRVQQRQQVGVIIVTVLISGLSIYGASSLETDFDLADFVDQEMPIMQVRDDISDSYESAGWKLVYVLFEPVSGESTIPGDDDLLAELRGFHSDLQSNNDVVGTNFRTPSPSYEGPYPVLRDAILRNASMGEAHNMEVYAGEVFSIERNEGVDLGAFFAVLANNQTIADPLTGESWSDRVRHTVNLDGSFILHFRNEVRVEAITSADSNRVIDNFDEVMGSTTESGTLKAQLKDHAQLHITGDLVVLQTVLEGLSLTQIESTAISLLVSFLVLFMLTRRTMPAVIVLFPVGVASLWVVGSMALIGLKWNVLTVMVTALTLGIGIDYSIHMWRRIEVELEKQHDHWKALRTSLNTTGMALTLSALTTMAGFLVLTFSPMPIIQDFGLITAITVMFSLVLSLVLLPVLVELVARAEESRIETENES